TTHTHSLSQHTPAETSRHRHTNKQKTGEKPTERHTHTIHTYTHTSRKQVRNPQKDTHTHTHTTALYWAVCFVSSLFRNIKVLSLYKAKQSPWICAAFNPKPFDCERDTSVRVAPSVRG